MQGIPDKDVIYVIINNNNLIVINKTVVNLLKEIIMLDIHERALREATEKLFKKVFRTNVQLHIKRRRTLLNVPKSEWGDAPTNSVTSFYSTVEFDYVRIAFTCDGKTWSIKKADRNRSVWIEQGNDNSRFLCNLYHVIDDEIDFEKDEKGVLVNWRNLTSDCAVGNTIVFRVETL